MPGGMPIALAHDGIDAQRSAARSVPHAFVGTAASDASCAPCAPCIAIVDA
jgi:hypothetical protein